MCNINIVCESLMLSTKEQLHLNFDIQQSTIVDIHTPLKTSR